MENSIQNKAIKKLYAKLVAESIYNKLFAETSFEVKLTNSSNSNIDGFKNIYSDLTGSYHEYTIYVNDEIEVKDLENNLLFIIEVNHSYPSTSGLQTETLDINTLVQIDIRVNKRYFNEEAPYNYLKHALNGKIGLSSNIIGDTCFSFLTGHVTDRDISSKVLKKLNKIIENYNTYKQEQENYNLNILLNR